MIPNFPEPMKADGSCEHLEDNLCKIYETRPDICRIDKGIEQNISGAKDKQYWRELTISFCNKYQVEDGMDESYRVNE